ncbi:Hypothetical predicted protein [Octopus vulgaris]|uniref:Uncharacterized protein n=1 Tax=Octopus vulgaris TaxID=6645 RepID=A0AA36AI21_OCTVU|nr:Hypothetical predicted protein [Octopus vulgaris]
MSVPTRIRWIVILMAKLTSPYNIKYLASNNCVYIDIGKLDLKRFRYLITGSHDDDEINDNSDDEVAGAAAAAAAATEVLVFGGGVDKRV